MKTEPIWDNYTFISGAAFAFPGNSVPVFGAIKEIDPTNLFKTAVHYFKRNISIIAISLVFVCFCLGSFAQPSDHISFTKLSTINGLSQSNVYSILKDKRGFMWFGTEDGLNKYDGYKFTVYRNNKKDTTGLHATSIHTVYEDKQGNIWIGSSGDGLSLYNRSKETFTQFKNAVAAPETLTDNDISAIYEDSKNNLWIGSYFGLNLFDRKTKKVTRYLDGPLMPTSQLKDNIRCIFEDSKGNVLIGTAGGLYKVDRSKQKIVPYIFSSNGRIAESVNAIYEDVNANLWIGTNGSGLYMLDRKTGKSVHFIQDAKNSNSINNNIVFCFADAGKGKMWIGTELGLNLLDYNTKTFSAFFSDPNEESSLSSNSIRSLLQDKQGILWVGTFAGGINKYDKNLPYFNLYKNSKTDSKSLSANNATSFAEDKKGNVWIGTDAGLNCLKKGSNEFVRYLHNDKSKNSLASNSILSVLQSNDNDNLWIGTYGSGLDLFNPGKNTFKNYSEGKGSGQLSQNSVYTLLEDRKGNLWIATNNKGVNVLNQATQKIKKLSYTLTDSSGTNSPAIRAFCEDNEGNIWMGTYGNGINIFNPLTNKFTYYNKANSSLGSNIVFSIFQDSKGNIWVGTSEGGLNLFDKKQKSFTSLTEENGLADNIINKITEDKNGYLWMSTNKGISRFNPKTRTFKNYSAYNNLQGYEFLLGSGLVTSSGDIYFGGIHGFNVFNPGSMGDNKNVPPVVITGFQLFNKPVAIGGKDSPLQQHISETGLITLSYEQSVFTFEFAALDFTTPEQNKYAYMLEGFDKGWNYVGDQRRATYTNINPGKYTFRVKACNNDGVWNEKGTAIKIIITPPIYKTWWFKLCVFITLITLACVFYRQKVNLIHRRNTELETQVKERTEKLALKTEEERKARKEAEEANRAKSIFLATMSHEIRTPMNGVIGMAALLAETNPSEEQGRFIEVIRSSGDNLLSVINNILDFSKMESGKLVLEQHPFDLRQSIEEVLDLFTIKAARSGLDLVFEMDFNVPCWICGDSLHLKQVLINLVSNAMKFTRQGEIFIGVKLAAKRVDAVEIIAEVRDTGIGIPADKLADLFNAFTQVDSSTTRKYGGTGLGLAIAKRLAELMNGSIRVESEPGKGTSFFFAFTASVAHQPVPIHLQYDTVDISNKKILLVDDNEKHLYILGNQLKHFNLISSNASSGYEALRFLEEKHDYDLVITDLLMPEMDGIELAKKIKSLHPALPVVLLTAVSHLNMTEHKSLFSAILPKPVKHQLLYRVILNGLEKNIGVIEKLPANKLTTGFASLHPMRILVAEDNEVNQFLIVKMLNKLGYQPVAANDGSEAIKELKANFYDLIFMDMQMPVMDGIDTTIYIRNEMGRQPVIIALTANALQEDRESCMKAGMNDYISKPVELNNLISMLEKWSAKISAFTEQTPELFFVLPS